MAALLPVVDILHNITPGQLGLLITVMLQRARLYLLAVPWIVQGEMQWGARLKCRLKTHSHHQAAVWASAVREAAISAETLTAATTKNSTSPASTASIGCPDLQPSSQGTETCSSFYCFCGKGFEGQMIACDEPSCAIEWFHYPCVGLRTRVIHQTYLVSVYVCMHVCMYVCMYVCMHVYLCMYVCMHVFGCMFMCVYACMCMCLYACVCMHVRMYVCMHVYVCMYACMYVCMYACVNICAYDTLLIGFGSILMALFFVRPFLLQIVFASN